MQALEPRVLLSGNAPDSFDDAVVVDLDTSPVVVVDAVGRGDPIDLFRIDVDERTDLVLTLSGLSANADLNLLDCDGRFIERSRRRDRRIGRSPQWRRSSSSAAGCSARST